MQLNRHYIIDKSIDGFKRYLLNQRSQIYYELDSLKRFSPTEDNFYFYCGLTKLIDMDKSFFYSLSYDEFLLVHKYISRKGEVDNVSLKPIYLKWLIVFKKERKTKYKHIKKEDLCRAIRILRENSDLSKSDIAKELGVVITTVYRV